MLGPYRRIGARSLTLAVALTLLLAACAALSPTATPTTVPVAAATSTKAPTATPTKRPLVKMVWVGADFSTSQLALWVTKGKGFFVEEGLDIDWVQTGSGAKAVAAALGGDSTVTSAASTDVVTVVSQGQPIQAFAAWYIGEIRELVMRKDVATAKNVTPKSSLPDKLQALKGLKIAAMSPGSGTDYGIRFLLTQYGMDPERDVEITYVGSADNILVALRQGSVDVGSTNDGGANAEYEGFGVTLISYTRGGVPAAKDKLGTLGIARKDRFGPDRETLEAFTRALWRGQRMAHERPDE
ncbi:MAG: ABC transporter substrate-binding protein, partial [Chloroflexi bacterium]|nr:ABC transporter substrate-binding protein [Chloroflexota bacterium]